METEDGHDVISQYRSVTRDVPDEIMDERILGMAIACTKRKTTARAWYALAATVVAAVIGISLYPLGRQSDAVIATDATDTFGLIEGNTRAFLLRQTSIEGMGPGDSFFVRIESDMEED